VLDRTGGLRLAESTKTVLIVEDSRPVRVKLRQLCTDLGLRDTLEAEHGVEALRVLAEVPVDLVLCDWKMPQMDGLSFLQSIKKIPKFKNLPVIFITTQTEKAKILDAFAGGATDYIVKPFDDEKVRQKIAGTLGLAAMM
jgi:two-component system chemotaxis response regulator CheY